jgi:hypothetical protein
MAEQHIAHSDVLSIPPTGGGALGGARLERVRRRKRARRAGESSVILRKLQLVRAGRRRGH